MQEQEHQTSEDELMNETLAEMKETQGIYEVAASIEQAEPSTGMKFVRPFNNFFIAFYLHWFFSIFMDCNFFYVRCQYQV